MPQNVLVLKTLFWDATSKSPREPAKIAEEIRAQNHLQQSMVATFVSNLDLETQAAS